MSVARHQPGFSLRRGVFIVNSHSWSNPVALSLNSTGFAFALYLTMFTVHIDIKGDFITANPAVTDRLFS